jgi:glycerophosphoryl diester phosphodiesterase
MPNSSQCFFLVGLFILTINWSVAAPPLSIQLGPRPMYLVDLMENSLLKKTLQNCEKGPFKKSKFSIGHRGAPLMFPEHTVESNVAAARMGAGVLECDVTFTMDKELVCRHAQNDLHSSTNILMTPLASKCVKPFEPSSKGRPASAECRTSEITLDEFMTLQPKMDGVNAAANNLQSYMDANPSWRTQLFGANTKLLTHKESIRLFKSLGTKFIPELKEPSVQMPFNGMTQENYAQKLIDEYKSEGIPARDVFPQSFSLRDVLYWIKNEPEFGKQAIYLDGRYQDKLFDPSNESTWQPSMSELKVMGVNYIAPPIWVLLTLDTTGKIIPSAYAIAAQKEKLKIMTWSLERDGPLNKGGGWYHQSIKSSINNDGKVYDVLDILYKQVGVQGVFSDWPATTTFYANCMGL